MENTQFFEEIRTLVARDDMKQSLERLKVFLENSPSRDEVFELAGSYESVLKKERTFVISYQEAAMEKARIRSSVLALMRILEDAPPPSPPPPPPPPPLVKKKVFISYSHKDEAFKNEMDTHFAALKHSGLIDVWHDRRIDAGTVWDDQIKSELEVADIILLMISADFLNSEYIWRVEIEHAMKRHKAREAKVVPIFIRPCDTDGLPFLAIQGLPYNAKPVSTFDNKDEAYLQIAKGIRSLLGA
jgi:hypothetical protein